MPILQGLASLGLIPARAGRTTVRPSWVCLCGAHPRSRGADGWRVWPAPTAPGSSPLARGGLNAAISATATTGLIPARAGRTACTATGRSSPRAHPRSRGADTPPARVNRRAWGSSPLARGGHDGGGAHCLVRGLIPARAGRTPFLCSTKARRGAHPRSRGADRFRLAPRPRSLGSSPLARGGRRCRPPGASPDRAHPRSRGADTTARARPRSAGGSSPLARGGLTLNAATLPPQGLIPARAGRTSDHPPTTRNHRAHPRSRGADEGASIRSAPALGSSPLARGGPATSSMPVMGPGLIPARAGRTNT